ncbi:fumarylacetoacetate hydrolase family protein [Rosenbergiella epipactidis]|uniref:fumarylacetoacetate hydrolase family protein n=1 Tax=Rosenbergiella epipactidis TaxID=1544694 RepID=UPI002026168A|nr:fumarylacetoacetate hydrolase family protein [Rosenbergiella epipactidis]MCL9668694.1 fumarylacetoacetate hydrolase family protein [Rosenbergiella epipactidis]
MINNIYCIGRNYVEHAQELGNRVEEDPVVFSKPNSALIVGDTITLPTFSQDVHYETELVIRISAPAFQIEPDQADAYYDSVAIGLDLTARDLQADLKSKKLPWLLAKGFNGSCYVSNFVAKQAVPQPIHFGLAINGKTVQQGVSSEMVFSIKQIIAFISRYIALQPGDIIFTGTPKGVGKLESGDTLRLTLEGEMMAELQVG